MPDFDFICPHCAAELTIGTELSNQEGTCPACDQTFLTPTLVFQDAPKERKARAPRKPSPKQRGMLEFLGIPVPETIDDASTAIDAALEKANDDQALWNRLQEWQSQRIFLHPQLYATELQSFKLGRVDSLHGENNGNCYDPFHPLKRLTKKQVGEAVSWLDRNQPGWDAKGIGIDTLYDHFVPTIEQLFPQCVKAMSRLRIDPVKAQASLRLNQQAAAPSRGKATASSGSSCLRIIVAVFIGLAIIIVFSLLTRQH